MQKPRGRPWRECLVLGKIKRPLRERVGRKWQPTPVFLPEESHGQRSLVGYSPPGSKELDTTERLHSFIQRKSG